MRAATAAVSRLLIDCNAAAHLQGVCHDTHALFIHSQLAAAMSPSCLKCTEFVPSNAYAMLPSSSSSLCQQACHLAKGYLQVYAVWHCCPELGWPACPCCSLLTTPFLPLPFFLCLLPCCELHSHPATVPHTCDNNNMSNLSTAGCHSSGLATHPPQHTSCYALLTILVVPALGPSPCCQLHSHPATVPVTTTIQTHWQLPSAAAARSTFLPSTHPATTY